jgi:hypothetical protein
MAKKKIWKKKFALTHGGPPRLILFSEEGEWKNVSVRVDGKEIGIVSHDLLKKGHVEFNLENGSILKFQNPSVSLIGVFFGAYNFNPEITIDGQVLYEYSTPAQFLKYAYGSIFLISGFGFLQLIFLILFQSVTAQSSSEFSNRAIVALSIIVVFLILGFMVYFRSKIALIIAIFLYGADCVLYLWNLVTQFNIQSFDLRWTLGVISVRIVLLILMFGGFPAIDDLKRGMR